MTPFFNNYIKLAETSEAPEFLYLWAAVSGVAALLSRNVYMPFGNGRINPNMYIMIIGDPGTRKSSAIKAMKARLRAVGYDSFCGDKVTMQKYLCDLAGVGEDGAAAEVEAKSSGTFKLPDIMLDSLGLRSAAAIADYVENYICQDEFSDFIGINNYPFISLLGNFWDIDQAYEYRLKNSQSLVIPTPLINILGGTTPGQFNTIFPSAIADQGFLSRMVLVSASVTSKKISWPEANAPAQLDAIDTHLRQIRNVKGQLHTSSAVKLLLDKIYKQWKGVDDGRFITYATRRHTQLLKLVVIMAASRLTLEATEADVVMANTLLTYTERHMPDALGQFGKQEDSDVSNRVVDILRKAHAPMSSMQLFASVSRDILMKDFVNIMGNLHSAGSIQLEKGKYLPIKRPIQQASDAYIDWSLLSAIVPDLLFSNSP